MDVNAFMPPGNPGTKKEDYAALVECAEKGPENTPGCEFVIPPADDCEGGIAQNQALESSSKGGKNAQNEKPKEEDDGDAKEQCSDNVNPTPGAACEGETVCQKDGTWYWCEDGAWQSK